MRWCESRAIECNAMQWQVGEKIIDTSMQKNQSIFIDESSWKWKVQVWITCEIQERQWEVRKKSFLTVTCQPAAVLQCCFHININTCFMQYTYQWVAIMKFYQCANLVLPFFVVGRRRCRVLLLISLSHRRQIVSWLILIYTKWSIKWFKGNYGTHAPTRTQTNLSTWFMLMLALPSTLSIEKCKIRMGE